MFIQRIDFNEVIPLEIYKNIFSYGKFHIKRNKTDWYFSLRIPFNYVAEVSHPYKMGKVVGVCNKIFQVAYTKKYGFEKRFFDILIKQISTLYENICLF